MKTQDLHVIGHSLGAHIAGYVGRRVSGIARVTGKCFFVFFFVVVVVVVFCFCLFCYCCWWRWFSVIASCKNIILFPSDTANTMTTLNIGTNRPEQHITKTYLYNFHPLKPHFYIVKLGFTGVYIIFLISAKNIDCGYLLEPPRRHLHCLPLIQQFSDKSACSGFVQNFRSSAIGKGDPIFRVNTVFVIEGRCH